MMKDNRPLFEKVGLRYCYRNPGLICLPLSCCPLAGNLSSHPILLIIRFLFSCFLRLERQDFSEGRIRGNSPIRQASEVIQVLLEKEKWDPKEGEIDFRGPFSVSVSFFSVCC